MHSTTKEEISSKWPASPPSRSEDELFSEPGDKSSSLSHMTGHFEKSALAAITQEQLGVTQNLGNANLQSSLMQSQKKFGSSFIGGNSSLTSGVHDRIIIEADNTNLARKFNRSFAQMEKIQEKEETQNQAILN